MPGAFDQFDARTKQTADEEEEIREGSIGAAPSPDQLLSQAQAALAVALGPWQLVSGMLAQAQKSTSAGNCAGTLSDTYAGLLQAASEGACNAASLAVQAARGYAPRCAAAARAAAGARECPGLDLSNEQAQQTPWGVVWNGQANCLDPNLVPQVGRQVAQAQASIAAAQAAKSAACPEPMRVAIPRRLTIGAGVSSYFSQQSDGSYSVNTDGIAGQLAAKDPSFASALTAGLVAGLEIEAVVTLAMGAVSIAATEGVAAASGLIVTAATGVGTAAGASAASTLTTAGAAAGGAVLAVPFVLAAVALAVWPAKAGPGCCGTDTSQPYGSCDPSGWAWINQLWVSGNGNYGSFPGAGLYTPPAPGSPEEFLDKTIETVFNKSNTCWSIAPPLGPLLTASVKAWNDAHSSSSTRTISRKVNNTVPGGTFNGAQQPAVTGQPQDNEPISVALNALAVNGGGIGGCTPSTCPAALVPDVQPPPAGSVMSITVNTGPLLTGSQLPLPIHLHPGATPAPASHVARNIALGTAGVAGAGLLTAFVVAQVKQTTTEEILKRAWRSTKSGTSRAYRRVKAIL
jgi:hypothetical protein